MVIKRVKTGIKVISTVLKVWAVFAVVASTAPYIPQKKVSENKKKEFEQMQFYGDGSTGPDQALVIETPSDALNIRIEMIRSAHSTVDIANHMIKDSETTRAYLGEIIAAADRGVQVRLLLDGKSTFFNPVNVSMLSALDAHPNIECRIYNPVSLLTPWRWHALLHDKFIIVDDQLLLLGGRNIDQRHFDPKDFKRAVTHDRDVLVWQAEASTADNLSAVYQAIDYMDQLWTYKLSKPITSRPMAAEKAQERRCTMKAAIASLEESNPQFYEKSLEDYLGDTVETSRVTLIFNPIEANAKEPWTAWQLSQLACEAQHRVVVQTPYATGNKKLLSSMAQAAGNAELIMITNSPASTPNIVAFSNYFGQRQKFLNTGAQIYEYQNTDSIHGKSLVIDERLSAVGSLNMDDRSFYLDTETMLLIDSPQFAAQLGDVLEDIKGQSLKVGEGNRYLPANDVHELGVPRVKLAVIKIASVLLRPIQFLI